MPKTRKWVLGNICLYIVIFMSAVLTAQRTQYYLDTERSFKEGIDLFQKQKYGAAQLRFEEFLKSDDQKTDYALSTATYYYAASSVELFHDNAEYLMLSFIHQFPHSNKVVQAYFQLGKLYFRKKDYHQVIAYFLKTDVFQLNREQVFEYYYKLGYSRFITGEYDKALKDFADIKDKKNPYQVPATYYFAHISYFNKNYEVALQHFLRIQHEKAFSRIIPFYVAQIYFVQGKYKEAVTYAEPIADTLKGKNLPIVRRLLAESYFELKDDAGAVRNYEAYIATGSSLDRLGNYRLGISYYRLSRFDDAALYLKNATSEDDLMTQTAYYYMADCFLKSDYKRMALDVLKLAASMNHDKRIAREALFNFAKLSYELGYNPYNEAIDAIQQYIEKYPDAKNIEDAYELMVNIYLNTQNYKDALISLQKIKNKNTRLKIAEQRIYYFRGIELFNNLEFTEAIRHFENAVLKNFDTRITAESKYWMAESYYRNKDYKGAQRMYEDFLTSSAAKSISYYNDAYYNLGYARIKMKQYNEAAVEFRNFITAAAQADLRKQHDALLRLGDCYFMIRNYAKAIEYYDQAIEIKQYNNDYALYQKSLMQGLMGNHEGKAATLKRTLNEYPQSAFRDEMLYELGMANIRLGNTNEAVKNFEDIVNGGSSSAYLSSAYLQLGLIYFNADNNREALGWYKRVVDEYPNSQHAAKALKYIRTIYVDMGDIDAYTQYVQGLNNVEVSMNSLDSASYEAGANAVEAGNCAKAIDAFDKYIRNFPRGVYLLDANHYKAECHYTQKEFSQALPHYQYIYRQRKNIYTENALSRAAYILEQQADTNGLIEVYTLMEESAESPDVLKRSRIGLMRNYYKTENCEKIIEYAKKVLTYEKLNEYVEEEAHYFQAVCYLKQNLLEEALAEYKKVYWQVASEFDIEAGYQIGDILFRQQKYKDAEKHLRAAIKTMGADKHRLALSFILLSDIYVAIDDLHQAKSMLNTVITHHDGEDLIKIAQKKLDAILAAERLQNQPRIEQEMETNDPDE